MIAIDTNLLIYAHRRDSPFHDPARSALARLATTARPWAIPWPCVHEFYGIVTHPRVYRPPSTRATAIDQIEAWLESPTVVLLAEAGGHWPQLRSLLVSGRIHGPRVHDARIAALCLAHGVRELWSADRDYSRFPTLTCSNPLSS